MMVRGRLDPGPEQSEEEREQGWVIRHPETTGRSQKRPEDHRTTNLIGGRYPDHIDRPAPRTRSFGGPDRSDLRTGGRRLDWFLKIAPFSEMRSKLDHQRGQTIDVGTMPTHPRGMSIKLPFHQVVPLPQSAHQGLIVSRKEPQVLLLLSKIPLQTVTLERFLVSKA